MTSPSKEILIHCLEMKNVMRELHVLVTVQATGTNSDQRVQAERKHK